MSTLRERIPAVNALNNAVSGLFPVRDECAETYHKLAGAWVAVGAVATEQTVSWAEKTVSSASPAELIGTIAVSIIPTGAAGFFWRRGWKSRGE